MTSVAATAPLLVCCGLVTLDVLQVVERLPEPDEKVVATGLEVGFGGPAANAAATAVALGVRTRLVTALGSGSIADLVRSGLLDAGIELVDLLDGAPGTPAVSTVLVTRATGERAVVSVNATGVGDLSARARALADDALSGASVLLLDGHHLGAAVTIAGRARAAGVTVVLDGGSWKPGLVELLALVDHAVLSGDFALPDELVVADAGELEAVAALGPRLVARSAGSGPVRYLLADGTRGAVTPPPVALDEVVDTLGAGDVLHGAYCAELVRGRSPVEALQRAAATATESVRHRGARSWSLPVPPAAPGRGRVTNRSPGDPGLGSVGVAP
ncbi:MAG TPA: PfkB family carbohydrate kinase [Cellulomonas sp.]|uniref:PfkB family carbohydrate kinase n=1 Tax=Cellulomonas sp. TaxID=40001 RepID=UPI002E37D309|nr:PfkB family carbohydrate kinase [Cellulomonas sp.]HEX5333962.1 PfkB family carbohydrate kinase [Cellulomonas sp.]